MENQLSIYNPDGVVMTYVLENGRSELFRLFARHRIFANPSPREIIKAIQTKGVHFLHDLDKSVIRPLATQMLQDMESEEGGVEQSAALLASPQASNKGDRIIAGLGTAINMLGTGIAGFQAIRGMKNQPQQTAQPQVIYQTTDDGPRTTDDSKVKDKDDTKKYLLIGGAALLAVAAIFFLTKKK